MTIDKQLTNDEKKNNNRFDTSATSGYIYKF